MHRLGALGAVVAILSVGCDLVVGIEDVTAGKACAGAADCTSADSCQLGACTLGVCTFVSAEDGVACGDPGQACDAGACACPEANACGAAGECADTLTDPTNCGQCGRACDKTETCDAGDCVCAPQNLCDGNCVDTSSVTTHCGECGHDCGAVACIDSVCEPFIVAAGQPFLASMVEDGADLYFTLGGGPVRTVSKAGGVPTELADGGNFGPYGIAVDTNTVYFSSFDTAINAVLSVPKSGGATTPIAPAEDYPGTIYLNAGTLYWGSAGGIRQYVVAAAGPAQDFAVVDFNGFALDDSYVYYTTDTQLFRQPRAGGAPAVVASGLTQAGPVVVDLQNAYVLETTSMAQKMAGEKVGALVRVQKSGGAPTVLVDGLASPSGLSVDGTHVYYADSLDKTVHRVLKGGGTPAPITKGYEVIGWMVVTGSQFLYFGDYTDDRIVRVPK